MNVIILSKKKNLPQVHYMYITTIRVIPLNLQAMSHLQKAEKPESQQFLLALPENVAEDAYSYSVPLVSARATDQSRRNVASHSTACWKGI